MYLTTASLTGRTTQIEVNADGTKTMLTGGTKTVYSWDTDKGGMSQKTETCFNCSCISELRLARLNNHLCVLPNFLTLSPTSSTLVASIHL
jgi:hypothetical protein